jgi:hypothetical protein
MEAARVRMRGRRSRRVGSGRGEFSHVSS